MEKNTARLQFILLRMKIPCLLEVQFVRGVARFEMAFFNDVVSWTYVTFLGKVYNRRDESKNGNE